MLGKTHLAVGIAAALTVTQPTTLAECFTAVIGGAVGGVLADVDTIKTDGTKGASQVQAFAVVLTVAILMLDSVLETGICAGFAKYSEETVAKGVVLFVLLWFACFCSDHRAFSHSLAAMCMFAWAVKRIYPPVCVSFLAGYGSHLAMDLMNKRPMKLFYPLDNGVCLGIFYAKQKANKFFLYAGCLLSAYFILKVCIH